MVAMVAFAKKACISSILFILLLSIFSCKAFPHEKIIREYTELDQEFKEKIILTLNNFYGNLQRISLTVEGSVVGNGVILVYHYPFTQSPSGAKISINVEGKINETITSPWYDKEFLIHFIPENSSVTGSIIITIEILL